VRLTGPVAKTVVARLGEDRISISTFVAGRMEGMGEAIRVKRHLSKPRKK
jgi:hypothetical protein